MTEQGRFFVFFFTWALLALASGLFIWKGSPRVKRACFPYIVVVAGVLFVAAAYWIVPTSRTLYFVVPPAALITLVNVRSVTFCPSCGAYHKSFGRLHRAGESCCRNCGANLS